MKIKKWLDDSPVVTCEFDDKDQIVVPDLELSPVEIMQRFKRGEPLDLLRRNGTFAVIDSDMDNVVSDDGDLSEYDGVDPSTLDLVEQQEMLDKAESVIKKVQNKMKSVTKKETAQKD